MKPIKNFRDRLNDAEFWQQGILFRLKLPMIRAEDLLWIMPENITHKWNVYIKFDWEKESYWVIKSEVYGSKTEAVSNGKIYIKDFVNHTVFINDFLTPLVNELLNKFTFD